MSEPGAARYRRQTIYTGGDGGRQDEVGLARLADVMLLLLVPQMGDEVRVFKAIVRTVATEVNEPYSVADEILKQAGYIETRD